MQPLWSWSLVVVAICAALACSLGARPQGEVPSSDVVKTAKGASYKVTYQINGLENDLSLEQTSYVKPPKSRYDIDGHIADVSGRPLSVYQLEDGAYWCYTFGGAAACFALPEVQHSYELHWDFVREECEEGPGDFDIAYRGTRQVAGQQGQCFVATPKSTAHRFWPEAVSCYSAQGILLFTQAESQKGELTIQEAVNVDTSVSDADFRLPAEPSPLQDFRLPAKPVTPPLRP